MTRRRHLRSTFTMNCDAHPRYKAMRRPTANCAACRLLWKATTTASLGVVREDTYADPELAHRASGEYECPECGLLPSDRRTRTRGAQCDGCGI